jgi:hypothetical protein
LFDHSNCRLPQDKEPQIIRVICGQNHLDLS